MLRRYRLDDWTPAAGPEDEWLASWASAGWVPHHAEGGTWNEVRRQTLNGVLAVKTPYGRLRCRSEMSENRSRSE